MINDLDIVQWAYLLDPAFQLVNSAGKPLTDGWIEVYYHGTRNKYYCASDFDGTLHPFKIPLDSLGSNIVLASPAYAYDIYVYNKFGSLVMSRYNVSPGNTGGNSGGGVQPTDEDAEHWLGQYGATQSLNGNSTGQTLYLPSRPDYQGDFVDRVEDNKYMYLKPGLYLVNCVIRFQQQSGTEVNRLDETLVYTGNGNANEDIAWQLDETGPLATGDRHCLKLTFIRKVLDTGETSTVDCSNILYFAPAPQVNWSDAYIQTLQIVKLGAGFGSSSASGVEYKAGPGISIDIYNNISVTGMQPASSMGDYVTYEVYNEFVNNVTGDLNDLQSEIDAVSAAVSGGGGGQVYTAGQYISIQGNEISVTGLQPEGDYASQSDLENLENVVNNVTGDVEEITNIINNVTGDVTNLTEIIEGVTGDIEQLNNEVQTVSASIPESEEVEFEELDLSQFAQASAVTGLEAQIQEVSSAIPDVSEITNVINNVTGDVQNLTTIVENVTGDINNLETIVNNVTGDINVLETNISGVTGDISQIESDIQTVSAAVDSVSAQIPESEEVEFEELDISNFATNSQVTAMEAEIQEVSAAIPPYQVQSDWTQDDDSQVDYIKNKPEETDVVAGPGISIVASGSTVTISTVGVATSGDIADLESQIQTVSAAIPTDVVTHDELAGVTGDYATNEDLQYVSGAVDEVSGNIPESKEVEFEELDLSQFVTESAVTGLEAEIQAVSGAIPEAQVNSDWAATGGVAEILNKPQELPLIAGLHINITETANGIVISSSAGSVTGDYATHAELAQVAADVQTVSAAIPTDVVTHAELSAVTGDYATNEDLQTVSAAIPDISNLATESEVQFVSGAIDAVSAGIPAAQVQSDWTQTATGEPDYIKHKPTETPLIAGNNITLTQSASGLIISSEGGSVTGDYATHAELSQVEADVQTVSAAIPDVSNLATNADLQTVSGAVDSVSASIPSQIEVEFKELDLSQFVTESAVTGLEAQIQTVSAAIPDVSNLATKSEVEAAVDTVTGMIPDVSNLATKSDLQTVSGAVDSVSASIPASEEVEFEELDLSQYVTESAVTGLEAEIQTVSASIPAAQVNSDWNAVSGKAEILNKPSESNLLAGAGITIAASGDDFVISAQGGGGSSYTAGQYISIENNEIAVTGLQPEGDYATNTALQTVSAKVDEVSGSIPSQVEVEFKELDLSQFVTESAVTGLEAEIQTVSAAIPDTSNFATEAELQTVSGAIPDVSSLATKTELQSVSGAVDSVSASIPSSEEVTFEELDVSAFATEADLQTVSAAIPDVSNLATKTEVGNVEADVQTVSAAIPDVSNFATDADVSAAVSGLQNKLTGITDVVVTNSLPVSPVATVLYLIPEA